MRKMNSKSYSLKPLLFFLLILLFKISSCDEEDLCLPLDELPCTCVFGKNGKLIVTLENLQAPLTTAVKTVDEDSVYYFDPCKILGDDKTKYIDEACAKSALCQDEKKILEWYELGNSTIEYRGVPLENLQFVYGVQKSAADNLYRRSTVNMVCEELVPNRLVFLNQSTDVKNNSPTHPLEYKFELAGDGACPKPNRRILSGGSVLLIIFFVGLFLYLVIGILVNKCVRGAVGLEVLPNYAFWSDLPSLVKDGCMFVYTCGCCKKEEQAQGYDNI